MAKFKVGDKIRHTIDGTTGVIVNPAVARGGRPSTCVVQLSDGRKVYYYASSLELIARAKDSRSVRLHRALDAVLKSQEPHDFWMPEASVEKFPKCALCGKVKHHPLHKVPAKDAEPNWRDRYEAMQLAERRGYAPTSRDGERYKKWLRDKDEARHMIAQGA